MKTITVDQIELIDAVLAEVDVGLLTASILEKDIHVTDALQALASMQFANTRLVFCGGTSLSKAYRLIERMSEDVDLKVVLDEYRIDSRSAQKKHLSNLKAEVVKLLEGLGFIEVESERQVRNENRYFASRWQYAPSYPHDTALRPYLSLELTARAPQFAVVTQPLDYLVNRLASRAEQLGQIDCVAVEETLAEKIISFLRRYAQYKAGALAQDWDDTLVRHIYDIYCIGLLDSEAASRAVAGFAAIVSYDVNEFGRQFPAFAESPARTLSAALEQAGQDTDIRTQYAEKLKPLIFGAVRPNFDEAYAVFRQHAEALIRQL